MTFVDHTHDAPQLVGFLWESDQLVTETSTRQHTTLTTDRHPLSPAGLKPIISVGDGPQNNALDHAAIGTGRYLYYGEN
jgi:hypothetical protein